MNKLTPGELRGVPFPKCHKKCKSTEFFGVCECEVFCPEKFTKFDEHPNHENTTETLEQKSCPGCENSQNRNLIECDVCGKRLR